MTTPGASAHWSTVQGFIQRQEAIGADPANKSGVRSAALRNAGAGVQAQDRIEARQERREGRAQRAGEGAANRNLIRERLEEQRQNRMARLQIHQDAQTHRTDLDQQRRLKAGARAGQTALEANPVIRWHDRIAAMPTPGGSGVLLLALILFVFMAVPVNRGQTRLGLLWFTLLGKTQLPGGGSAEAANVNANPGILDKAKQDPTVGPGVSLVAPGVAGAGNFNAGSTAVGSNGSNGSTGHGPSPLALPSYIQVRR